MAPRDDVPPNDESAGPPAPRDGAVPAGPYRIQTFAELTGVPEPTLRAWERRYGVPAPMRTASGYRLYGGSEVHQVREMRRLCTQGMAAAEAARVVLAGGAGAARHAANPYTLTMNALVECVARLDVVQFEEQLRRALMFDSSTTLFERVLAPTLTRIGELWHAGELSVAQEHFASQRIGHFVRDLTRLLVRDDAESTAIVACTANEDHEIGALGVAMRLASWGIRPVFLGARTPPSAIRGAVELLAPKLVALSVTMPPERAKARTLADGYASACGAIPWIVGGAGAETMTDLVRKAGGVVASSEVSALRATVRLALGHSSRGVPLQTGHIGESPRRTSRRRRAGASGRGA